jgi:L-alanine-DL-glutamate epimerase-like enolase superfamily enzyme
VKSGKGYVELIAGPGLGVELDDAKVMKFTVV